MFKLYCWFFSCGYCSEVIIFNSKASSFLFMVCASSARGGNMDVCNFLLEMTPRPLDDRILVERAKLHLSFQKLGI